MAGGAWACWSLLDGSAIVLAPFSVAPWRRARDAVGAVTLAALAVVTLLPERAWPAAGLALASLAEAAMVLARARRREPWGAGAFSGLALAVGDAVALLGPAGPLPYPRSLWWAVAAEAAAVQAALLAIEVRDRLRPRAGA